MLRIVLCSGKKNGCLHKFFLNMARVSFLEAKSLMSDCSYSHLEEISSQRHIVLSPKFLGNIKNGVAAQLNSELQLLAKW